MTRTHIVLIGLAAALLTGCNQTPPAPANPLAGDPNVNGWDSVRRADLSVPAGVHYATINVGGATVAEISGVPEDASPSAATGGVSVRMSQEIETHASGGSVRVVVRAYAPEEGSALGLAYSTNEVGNSGWRRFPLTQTPTDYVLTYSVPTMRQGGGDYLGFRSYGNGVVRVVGFKVEATPAPASTSTPTQQSPTLRPTTSATSSP